MSKDPSSELPGRCRITSTVQSQFFRQIGLADVDLSPPPHSRLVHMDICSMRRRFLRASLTHCTHNHGTDVTVTLTFDHIKSNHFFIADSEVDTDSKTIPRGDPEICGKHRFSPGFLPTAGTVLLQTDGISGRSSVLIFVIHLTKRCFACG